MTTSTVPTGWVRRRDRKDSPPRDIKELYAAFLKDYADETRRKYLRWLTAYALYLDRVEDEDGHRLFIHPFEADTEDVDSFLGLLASVHWDEHPGPCMPVCEYLPIGGRQRSDARVAIRSFYDWTTERHYTPHQVVPRQRGRRGKGQTVAEAQGKNICLPHELVDVMQAAKQAGPMTEMSIGLFVGTGMRPEEHHRLDVDWFKRERGGTHLTFQRVKKGESGTTEFYWDTIRLGDRLAEIVWRGIGDRTHGPLILTTGRRRAHDDQGNLTHGRQDKSGVARTVKRICAQAGVEDASPKLFRDTFITLASTEPGVTLQTICDYVAHENINTTMGYFNGKTLRRRGATGRQHNLWGPDWSKTYA